MKQKIDQNDIVVLVHGLAGSRLDLWPLGRRLKRRGYAVINWTYRTIGHRIETHAQRLAGDRDHCSDDVCQSRHRQTWARRDAGPTASRITCRSQAGAVRRLADAQPKTVVRC